jgi:hypothetical protein
MTATAIRLIASREIWARWIMWPIALVLALVAVAVPRLVAESDQPSVANAIWVCACVVPVGISVIVGTTLLGGERGEGRLAFYFARPIAAWQIVVGKLLGGLVLAVVTQVIFVVVAGLALPGPARFGTIGAPLVMASVAGVPFGLAAGIVARARTRWLALDIASLVAVIAALGTAALHPLAGRRWGFEPRDVLEKTFARARAEIESLAIAAIAIALVVLVIAAVRAVVVGRGELARSHAVLSRTLWAIALPACAVVVAIALAT